MGNTNLQRTKLLDALWDEHRRRGCVSADAMNKIARDLKMTPAEVRETTSFYTMFSEAPLGKHHIEVCVGLCCRLKGADEILSYLKEKLGVEVGETTSDGMFYLSTVECLGSCGTAPVIMVEEKYYESVTKEKIDEMLKSLSF